MVTAIVLGVTITLAAVLCTVLLVKYGITINYNKKFTIDDKRAHLTPEQLQVLEQNLNKDTTVNKKEPEYPGGPMDAVIAEIQNLFGPEIEEGKNERK